VRGGGAATKANPAATADGEAVFQAGKAEKRAGLQQTTDVLPSTSHRPSLPDWVRKVRAVVRWPESESQGTPGGVVVRARSNFPNRGGPPRTDTMTPPEPYRRVPPAPAARFVEAS